MKRVVSQYFSSVPEDRKQMLDTLHSLIVELFPRAEINMQYKMPTYRVGDGWVAIANQKHYVSLYTCGYHHIAEFKKRHPDIKTGKGCINFNPQDRLPIRELTAVIRHAVQHPKLTDTEKLK